MFLPRFITHRCLVPKKLGGKSLFHVKDAMMTDCSVDTFGECYLICFPTTLLNDTKTYIALAKSLTVPQLTYLRERFTLSGPNKSRCISLQSFKTDVTKNSMEAMKDSRILYYANMMSTLQYRKLDFEEFCAATICVHRLEGMESWEQHAHTNYDRRISLGTWT